MRGASVSERSLVRVCCERERSKHGQWALLSVRVIVYVHSGGEAACGRAPPTDRENNKCFVAVSHISVVDNTKKLRRHSDDAI